MAAGLAAVFMTDQRNPGNLPLSHLNYKDLRDQNQVFTEMAGFTFAQLNWSTGSESEQIPAQVVSGNYFSLLGVPAFAAVIATGAFTVGAMASALYLVKARAERRTDASSTGYVARLPKAAVLDRVAYRVHAFGFPVWTFAALVAGPIWAEYAWGSYWNWDPKEVWAFITWVVYAGYLHARATAGWKGRAAAILCLVGFATFVFNFIGVNLFVGGLHSYAK